MSRNLASSAGSAWAGAAPHAMAAMSAPVLSDVAMARVARTRGGPDSRRYREPRRDNIVRSFDSTADLWINHTGVARFGVLASRNAVPDCCVGVSQLIGEVRAGLGAEGGRLDVDARPNPVGSVGLVRAARILRYVDAGHRRSRPDSATLAVSPLSGQTRDFPYLDRT